MEDVNPLEYIPHRPSKQGTWEGVYEMASDLYPAYRVVEIAHSVPYMLEEFYNEAPLAEIAAEVITPWQYKAYKDAQNSGKEYKFDPSSFSADVLEMLPASAPVMCGVEAADNAFDDGEKYDTAVARALGVGTGVGLATAIPMGGKILKFGEKIAPHMAKAAQKVFPKVATPASFGTMIVAPSIIEGSMSDQESNNQ